MRLAILSDIHGNPLALEAVLRDINAQGGVDGYWMVGDFCGIGYDPVTPLERIAALSNVVVTRGNTDRYIVTGELPHPTIEDAQQNPEHVPLAVRIARSFAWSRGFLTAHGWLEWLDDLPVEQRLTLPDGTQMLAVHASPGQDDGPGLMPDMPADKVEALFGNADADLVFVGHIHVPSERQVGATRVVNVASVSNPMTPDMRPRYVMLEADEGGYRLESRRVSLDVGEVIDAIQQSRHPTVDYLLHFWTPGV
ncbi:MAG: metallophosphoesterase family protein [Chloroflexi bacterium]|nr:metallophosphoesterase family protein [Chloroflexota bacterium]